MPHSTLSDITVQLVHETEKAWLVDDGSRKEWIPKSAGEMDLNKDGTYCLTIPEWLAKERGLI